MSIRLIEFKLQNNSHKCDGTVIVTHFPIATYRFWKQRAYLPVPQNLFRNIFWAMQTSKKLPATISTEAFS